MAITEDLDLNVTDALREIDKLLSGAKSISEVLSTSVTEGLAPLSNVTVENVDATQVSDSVADAVSEGSAAEAVVENTDATDVALAVTDAVVEGSDTPVVVNDVDASQVGEEIAGAVTGADTSVELEVSADVTQAEADIAGLGAGSDPIEVPVSAPGADETTAQIQGVTDATNKATESNAAFSGSLGAVSNLATISTGKVAGLGNLVSSLGPKAAGSAAAFTAVGFAVKDFYNEGLNAIASTERFNAVLGTSAKTVDNIDVGSLTSDISKLTLSLGLSDDALRNADASIFRFAQSSGLANPQAAELATNVNALALRAAAGNSAISDIGGAAEGLSSALARGGRTLRAYDIDLTGAEIKARALTLAAQGIGDGVSQASLSFAGGQLAIEKYGKTLKQDIEVGSKNAAIQNRVLATTFAEAREEIGKPLVAPVQSLLRDLIPLAVLVAQSIGKVAEAGLPVAQVLAEIAGGAVKAVGGLLDLADGLGILVPGLQAVALAIVGIKFASLVTGAVNAGLSIATSLIPALTGVGVAALPLAPILGGVAAVALVGFAAFKIFGGGADEAGKRTEDFKHQVIDAIPFMEQIGTEFISAADAAKQYIDTLGKKIESGDTVFSKSAIASIKESGLTFQTVGRLAFQGVEGVDAFTASLIDSGSVTAKQLEKTRAGYKHQDVDLQALLKTDREGTLERIRNGDILLASGAKEIRQFKELQAAQDAGVKSTIQNFVATEQLDQAQANKIVTQNTLKNGTFDYATALAEANSLIQENLALEKFQAEELVRAQAPLADNAAAWLALGDAVAQGLVNLDDPKQINELATNLGVTTDQIKDYGKAVEGAIDSFVSATVGKFPSVIGGIKSVEDATDPKKVLENLHEQELAFAAYIRAINGDAFTGFGTLKAFIASQTPEIGGALAKALENASPKEKQAWEDQLKRTIAAGGDARAAVTAMGPEFARALGIVASTGTETFNENMNLPTVTQEKLDAAAAIMGLPANSLKLNEAGGTAANGAVTGFDTKLSTGFGSAASRAGGVVKTTLSSPEELAKANAGGAALGTSVIDGFTQSVQSQAAANKLKSAAGFASGTFNARFSGPQGIDAHSPSKLYKKFGRDVTDGFVLGVTGGLGDVENVAKQLSDASAIDFSIPVFPSFKAVAAPNDLVTVGARENTTTQTVAPSSGGVRDIIVNEVANDPNATAIAVSSRLGLKART